MIPNHYKSYWFWFRFEIFYMLRWLILIVLPFILILAYISFFQANRDIKNSICYSEAGVLLEPNSDNLLTCTESEVDELTDRIRKAQNTIAYRFGALLIIAAIAGAELMRVKQKEHLWHHRRRYQIKHGHPFAFLVHRYQRIYQWMKQTWLRVRYPIIGMFVIIIVAVWIKFATLSSDIFTAVFYLPLIILTCYLAMRGLAEMTHNERLISFLNPSRPQIETIDAGFGGLVYTDDGALLPAESLADYQRDSQDQRWAWLTSYFPTRYQVFEFTRFLGFIWLIVGMIWTTVAIFQGVGDWRTHIMTLIWLTFLAIFVGGRRVSYWVTLVREAYHYWRYTPDLSDWDNLDAQAYVISNDGELIPDPELFDEQHVNL